MQVITSYETFRRQLAYARWLALRGAPGARDAQLAKELEDFVRYDEAPPRGDRATILASDYVRNAARWAGAYEGLGHYPTREKLMGYADAYEARRDARRAAARAKPKPPAAPVARAPRPPREKKAPRPLTDSERHERLLLSQALTLAAESGDAETLAELARFTFNVTRAELHAAPPRPEQRAEGLARNLWHLANSYRLKGRATDAEELFAIVQGHQARAARPRVERTEHTTRHGAQLAWKLANPARRHNHAGGPGAVRALSERELASLFVSLRARFARRYPHVRACSLDLSDTYASPGRSGYRDLAWCEPATGRVFLCRRALAMGRATVEGLLLHELGHCADRRAHQNGAEKRADRLARKATGTRVRYDAHNIQTTRRRGTLAVRPPHLHQ